MFDIMKAAFEYRDNKSISRASAKLYYNIADENYYDKKHVLVYYKKIGLKTTIENLCDERKIIPFISCCEVGKKIIWDYINSFKDDDLCRQMKKAERESSDIDQFVWYYLEFFHKYDCLDSLCEFESRAITRILIKWAHKNELYDICNEKWYENPEIRLYAR